MVEAFKIQAGTFEEFWVLLLAIPNQYRPDAAEALRVAWHSARAAERKTPTQYCSRCDLDKPRVLFPDNEWKKRPELKRYCSQCKKETQTGRSGEPKLEQKTRVWAKTLRSNYEEDSQVKSQSKGVKRFFTPHP